VELNLKFKKYSFYMQITQIYQLLANAVLVLHVAYVLFVVLGLLLIVVGGFLKWAWVRNRWFRVLHLVAIGYVVAESWLGITCPLTTLELWLRRLAGQVAYNGDFIAYWLRKILFFQAPPWVFTVCYTAFAGLVLATWLFFPPRSSKPTSVAPN
jgi:Protein of Unknown function (DUF2784)